MEFPKYEHKYLSVFDNNEDYEEQTSVIEECNWSAIRDPNQTDTDKKDYYPSVRPTNEDNKYVMNWYSSDELKKKFALEITWGYYGFEWVDYEYNGEILKGGNLYTIKEITKVPTVADGYRLQHINNFLNTQNKVIEIEWFDTSNIISAKQAFYRGSDPSLPPLIFNIYDWDSLEDATHMFIYQTVHAQDIINMKKVKYLTGFNSYSNYSNIKINTTNTVLNIDELLMNIKQNVEPINNEIDIFSIIFNDYDFSNLTSAKKVFPFSIYTNHTEDNLTLKINFKGIGDQIIDASELSLPTIYYKKDNTNATIKNYNVVITSNIKLNLYKAFQKINIDYLFISIDENIITNLEQAFSSSSTANLKNIPIDHIIEHASMENIYNNRNFIGTGLSFNFSINNTYHNEILLKSLGGTYPIDFSFINFDKLATIGINKLNYAEPIFLNYNFTNENDPRENKYRPWLLNNTNITGIKEQLFKVKADNSTNNEILYNCSNIDFTNTNTVIEISHEDIGNGSIILLNNCPELVTTPIIKSVQDTLFYVKMLYNCPKLVNIRMSEFNFKSVNYNGMDQYLDLSLSPELVYFNIGYFSEMSLILTNCTKLDIETFMQSMNRCLEYRVNKELDARGYLTIMKNVYDKFTEEDKGIILQIFNVVNVVENEE